MSYDFKLFKRRAGEDVLDTARADTDCFSMSQPDPQKEALKRKVADALINQHSKLQVFPFDYDAVAKSQKISVEDARLKFRYLELNGPMENCSGIQITLYDDEAAVTVAFWHESDKAADIFREIWSYLNIISREAGYLIYDPQLDRIVDPAAGFDDALACYAGAMREIHPTLSASGGEKKPWWKFW